MPATLCIHIRSALQVTSEEIRFFDAEDWNTESEMQVMAKILEIFSLTRTDGIAVHFDMPSST